MLNLVAQQIKILIEVENFHKLLDRYSAVLGDAALDESLWRLEHRDLEYRVDQLALEISSAELDRQGIDSIAQYTKGDDAEILSDYDNLKYYLKFNDAHVQPDKAGRYPRSAREKMLQDWKSNRIQG